MKAESAILGSAPVVVTSRYEGAEPLAGSHPGFFRVYDRVRGEAVVLCRLQEGDVGRGAVGRIRDLFLALSHLEHPALARVYDFGRTESAVFYTREFGQPQTIVAALSPGDERALVQALVGFAGGLAALHGEKVVHGLTIPAHLTAAVQEKRLGNIRLTDAGLYRLLPGVVEAHASYLPAEVRAGAEPSAASDLYGLGASLLEAVAGKEALDALAHGRPRPFRTAGVRGVDRHLLDLLDRLVAQDPRERPADASELARILRDPTWVLPERRPEVEDLVSPALVGREKAMSQLGEALRRAAAGEVHAAEVVGGAGMGRTRLLREVAESAATLGWTPVWVTWRADGDPVSALSNAVQSAFGESPAAEEITGGATGQSHLGRSPGHDDGLDTRLWARLADLTRGAVDAARGRLLILADDADRLPADLLAALRYLVTETGGRPILIVAAGARSCGLPDAALIEIGALGERDLRRLLAPLLPRS
jgi:hypothetical protein